MPKPEYTTVPNTKVKEYTVVATVQFGVQATSIPAAYKLFQKWMAKAFEDSFTDSNKPDIAPSFYEGFLVCEGKAHKL